MLMVGDRVDDVAAARAHSIRAIGVAWGYGTPDELLAAGAFTVVATVGELVARIQSLDGRVTAAIPPRSRGCESGARPPGSR